MYQNKESTDMREIKRGEVYFIDLSNIDYLDSHIIGKSRPGLIIQNDVGNENSPNIIVALITTADKRPYPFQYKLNLNGRLSTIMFDQIMVVSKQNINDKIGELTAQEIRESDIALMCSLSLSHYSMLSIKDFSITHVVTERTRNNEVTNFVFEISHMVGDREQNKVGNIDVKDISKFDPSITKDSDLDEIKDKLNNCVGLNFIANHIQF